MTLDPTYAAQLMRRATRFAVATAVILTLAKGVAWWLSGSVSMLAGLTDSLLDSIASIINLLAVHYSLRPADNNHRFGHGKAEALAGLGQSVFIALSAVFVAWQAIDHLRNPEPIDAGWLSIAVIIMSIALTVLLLFFQRFVVKTTGSTAVHADSLHYRSDLLLNIGILLALIGAMLGYPKTDPIFALLVAGYILWSAQEILRDAFAVLMDQQLPDEITQHMQQLACSVKGVLGCHDLRAHASGQHWFVQLHLELPAHLSLLEAHGLCDQVEASIRKAYPLSEVLVHPDPVPRSSGLASD